MAYPRNAPTAATNRSASSSHGKCPAPGWTTSLAWGNSPANSASARGGPPALAGLAPVLGRTRTALLAALAEPLTTAALASRLGITPSAVSQHLGALRGAGLVSTERNGRTALHLRTERATHLLGASVP